MHKAKQLLFLVGLLVLLLSLVSACLPRFQPGTYTDDAGRAVRIDKAPQRIVSHVPSITETLFALGLEEKVVGRSDYDDYPEQAKLKPSVGGFWNPSLENIVALNPDLVLTDGQSESVKQLDGLGITRLVIYPKDIEGIFKSIELLGKVAGAEGRAEKLVSGMRQNMANILNLVKNAPKVRVFYIIDATDLNNPWTAGPGSFIDALIAMAAGQNIAAQAPGAWVKFSIEQVVSSDPEVIILPARMGTAFTSPDMLKAHPAWRETTAVKQGRIYLIDTNLVSRSGPRIIQGLEDMARAIHPELFKYGG